MADTPTRTAILEVADRTREHRTALVRLGGKLANLEYVLRDVAAAAVLEAEAKAAARDTIESLGESMRAIEEACRAARRGFAAARLLIEDGRGAK